MGKLKQLEPRLRSLKPRVAILKPDYDQTRRQKHSWRKWYSRARWKRLRWSCLSRDLFTCQMCGETKDDTSQLEADHMVRHNGDPVKFWNLDNLQCLCNVCHGREKQREEAMEAAAARVGGV